jgi:endonuclease-3 related protein
MIAMTTALHPVTARQDQEQLAAQRLRLVHDELLSNYGAQHWWPARTTIETVVGAYLTQNTAWRNVERSIVNLEQAGVLSVDGLRTIEIESLRTLIRPSGYMVRKAMAIKAFIQMLDAVYGGSLEALATTPPHIAREALLGLPGVGPETADAILLYALGQPVMVVDEYLRRVTTRHGLIDERARYADLQQLALAAFAGEPVTTLPAHYNEFHALIVEVGKEHCGGIPRCAGCPLNQPRFSPPQTPAPRVPGELTGSSPRGKAR